MSFAAAEQIANAVLYEGYLLYPYRASAQKNRVRWQFGVVAPREFSEETGSDPWFAQTECLIEPQGLPSIELRVRFLEVRANAEENSPEVDEGIEHSVDVTGLQLADLIAADRCESIVVPGAAIQAALRISASPVGRWFRLRIRIENTTPGSDALSRSEAMRLSLVGTHTLVCVHNGRFLSQQDPPRDALEATAECRNLHSWPVLAGPLGDDTTILSAPIILYDHPAIAPESPGDLFDATEIDEILTLRIMTLTEDEKREARSTDARARAIVDRADSMSSATLSRLHGAMRDAGGAAAATVADAAWNDLLNPPGENPETAQVDVAGVTVAKGSRVVVRPQRRADPIDLFLAGRIARVEGVYRDLEGRTLVAVVLDDDPSGELHAEFGRFFYYGPDEIEPVPSGVAARPSGRASGENP